MGPAEINPGIYTLQKRSDAVKLANAISDIKEKSRVARIWQMIKSGITRRVNLPAPTTVAEYDSLKAVQTLLSALEEKKLCTRKISPFDLPKDFSWSHGAAKKLSRQIVLRHWTTPGMKHSSIHTALSIKDKDSDINQYIAWVPRPYRQGKENWSKSSNIVKRALAPLKRNLFDGPSIKLEELTTRDFPYSPPSYRDEKGLYINSKTKFKLQDGAEARELLKKANTPTPEPASNERADQDETEKQDRQEKPKNRIKRLFNRRRKKQKDKVQANAPQEKPETPPPPQITDEIVKKANYKPLPYQKTSSKDNTDWQRRAEKHYLPCIGSATDLETNRPKFVLFGLKQEKMLARWNEVYDPDHPEHYYQQFSTEHNCSGMTLHLLKSGGSEMYEKFSTRLVTTQGDMEDYAEKLMTKLDNLNEYVDKLNEKMRVFRTPNNPDLPLPEIAEKLSGVVDRYTLPSKWRAHFNNAVRGIASLEKARQAGAGFDELNPLAQKLTTAIRGIDLASEENPYLEGGLEFALQAFRVLQNTMIEAYNSEAPGDQ